MLVEQASELKKSFTKDELATYQLLFDHYEDMNSNDSQASHIEAVEAVVSKRV